MVENNRESEMIKFLEIMIFSYLAIIVIVVFIALNWMIINMIKMIYDDVFGGK
jgi:hypothetical protein